MTLTDSGFRHAQHLKYWLRCFKTLIPTHYTSADSSRLSFVYFTISALDVLGYEFTEDDRSSAITWIYNLQHAGGGFRSSPSTDLSSTADGQQRVGISHRHAWDQPDLPGTFFALICLGILRDELKHLRREKCLLWLKQLQREDGSFGECIGPDDRIAGGADSRFSYFAAATRWLLRPGQSEDFRSADLTAWVQASQTYEYGFSETKYHEAHAGFTYCALAALALLENAESVRPSPFRPPIFPEANHILEWLLKRQTALSEDDLSKPPDSESEEPPSGSTLAGFVNHELASAGFNGRSGKYADTCYSFWVGASLRILGASKLSNQTLDRSFLLSRTQHFIGGFGKLPGDKPDILHSYLGLVALALNPEPHHALPFIDQRHPGAIESLKRVDPVLCISQSTTIWLRDRISAKSEVKP